MDAWPHIATFSYGLSVVVIYEGVIYWEDVMQRLCKAVALKAVHQITVCYDCKKRMMVHVDIIASEAARLIDAVAFGLAPCTGAVQFLHAGRHMRDLVGDARKGHECVYWARIIFFQNMTHYKQ